MTFRGFLPYATAILLLWLSTGHADLLPSARSATASPNNHNTPVSRAVSLAPHITELIFAAGAGDKIIATVSSSDYPAAALKIPKIGDGLNISTERIISLKPDLVIAWQVAGAAQTLTPILAQLHIPLIYSAPKQLNDIPKEIIRFGQLFGTQDTAEPAALKLQQRLDTLRAQYSQRPTVSVFIEVGTAPLYTIGRDPLLNDALHTCGGVNIFSTSMLAAPQVSTEQLLLAQPDVVITAQADPARLKGRIQEWSNLHLIAARKGHIYRIDPDALFRPSPRLVDATEKLCQYLEQTR